ncbi:MAG: 2-amino-4-hydroxy-6-hydroxymethyldihydropteridine diphosphokinase [Clostridia bacterium]|nr:2-amino-4-hydroxy-6-hydroxymethyldihydropteridine diphosphokinase [Clostridia bacterium]MDD4571183.1 2-amino-4-hydroxy-6-hydroxymethyldihydropteridine diphosphokinase [Clostridia bacterium]
MRNRAFLSLGSNMGNKRGYLEAAIKDLRAVSTIEVLAVSSFYQNPAVGEIEQDDFVNAVVYIDTALTPHQLLWQVNQIENAHGRQRIIEGGPRTLDIDILLFGDKNDNPEKVAKLVDEMYLTIPHPEMAKRAFVLVPLLEIAFDVQIPGQGKVKDLLEKLDINDIIKLDLD